MQRSEQEVDSSGLLQCVPELGLNRFTREAPSKTTTRWWSRASVFVK